MDSLQILPAAANFGVSHCWRNSVIMMYGPNRSE